VDVTQALVDSTFPHGISAFDESSQQAFALVQPEVKEDGQGRTLILLWGEANKDFYFDVTDVEELAVDRWRVKSLNGGGTVIFNPLSEKRAQSVLANLEDS
jgi:hypothetical protein